MGFEEMFFADLAPVDYFVFAGFFGAVIVYTIFFVNRGRVVPVLFAAALAYVLAEVQPYSAGSSGEVILWFFIIAFFLIFFLLSRVVLQSPVGVETFGLFFSGVLAISQIGFLFAALGSFLPVVLREQLSSLSQSVFLQKNALFYWAAAAVLLLLFSSRRANELIK